MGSSLKILQIKEFLEETFKILFYYRARVVFSLSGVALGILSICVIITTIDGANKKAYEIFEALGPDSIMIFSGSERQRMARERVITLTYRDAESIERVEGIYDITKTYSVRGLIMRYRDRKWQTNVIGSTENYFDAYKWNLYMGTVFKRDDVLNVEPVCVIGYKVYDELFRGEEAVGKTILIGRLHTRVIGVLEEKGGAAGGPHIDDRVVMPLSTVTSKLANEKRYVGALRVKTTRDVDATIEDIKMVLRKNHGIKGEQDDFTVRSSRDMLQFMSVISGSLFLFLGTASVVALVVSGFVLANLFYLTI
ncbi:MAG: ABC transporter permease, partial [Syntrophorhabdales bacterium]|nr:ABC transporter permease [Syntrophorhabdales bacterium]